MLARIAERGPAPKNRQMCVKKLRKASDSEKRLNEFDFVLSVQWGISGCHDFFSFYIKILKISALRIELCFHNVQYSGRCGRR